MILVSWIHDTKNMCWSFLAPAAKFPTFNLFFLLLFTRISLQPTSCSPHVCYVNLFAPFTSQKLQPHSFSTASMTGHFAFASLAIPFHIPPFSPFLLPYLGVIYLVLFCCHIQLHSVCPHLPHRHCRQKNMLWLPVR